MSIDEQLLKQLERARNELLDLTARNRLLNMQMGRGRSSRIDIRGHLANDVFDVLVRQEKEAGFTGVVGSGDPKMEDTTQQVDKEFATSPRRRSSRTPESGDSSRDISLSESSQDAAIDPPEDEPTGPGLSQPEESSGGQDSGLPAYTLSTPLSDDKLQTRLLRLLYDAEALVQDQGVNSLFLAIGFLEWYESDTSDKARYAPLLLIPVGLNRKSVKGRIRMRMLDDEIQTNHSLLAKLRQDFGLILDEIPPIDDLVPLDYFSKVESVIADKPRWRVHRDRMCVSFFSFAKFVIWFDLDPKSWPEGKGPLRNSLVRRLLEKSDTYEPPLVGDDEPLDTKFDLASLCHVLDADSSQAAVIESVRGGRNLVVSGPPGTGKSQTIVNVIASAVRDGKSVLFVSEKKAALEVVKLRLDGIGLGDIALELHSHKANRKAVLQELARTLDLGKPSVAGVSKQVTELVRVRDRLNRYVEQLHAPTCEGEKDETPFTLMGRLSRLQAAGVKPLPSFPADLPAWSPTTLRERRDLLRDIHEHLAELGAPAESPWYGVGRRDIVMLSDLDGLKRDLGILGCNLQQLLDLSREMMRFVENVGDTDGFGLEFVPQLVNFVGRLRKAPECDRSAFNNPIWSKRRDEIRKYVNLGKKLQWLRSKLSSLVVEEAWSEDVSDLRSEFESLSNNWLRWFDSRWWAIKKETERLLLPPGRGSNQDILDSLEKLVSARNFADGFRDDAPMGIGGQLAFGAKWQGENTNWDECEKVIAFEEACRKGWSPPNLHDLIANFQDSEAIRKARSEIVKLFEPTLELIKRVFKVLDVDVPKAFGTKTIQETPLPRLVDRITTFIDAIDTLGRWIQFQRQVRELHDKGLGALQPQIDAGEIDGGTVDALDLVYCESVLRKVLPERETVGGFDGIVHNRLVEEFRKLDRQRIEFARREVASAHFGQLPSGSNAGEVGTIRTEIGKKRRHLALRRLLREAGRAVQMMKPVFMMSPISVAQFLEPGKLEFDLVVIDEASQVRPVEALGAITRSRQLVVVGDKKQLPPSAFFAPLPGDEEPDEDQPSLRVSDVESILELCSSRGIREQSLRWHYRSRHHSLIALSNREFYEKKLFIVPSPQGSGPGEGLEFRHVPNGVYDRGKTKTNREEARVVARAMVDHARLHPTRSLGVGTFSGTQRDMILDELELLRREHPETESFFSKDSNEPWFVKNLENIQGDERDTIFISVGYGPDANGNVSMNFGPVGDPGGERRLNVLITRAKHQCVVFSSIRADDIDLRRAKSEGVKVFKEFVHFAETGLDLARTGIREMDSEFEYDVADALSGNGWKVDPQVGVAGFFIDLAVIDPDCEGRYILGVECDGATYHSARWARDRDRLRQEVLEGHGWRIHRIWSTDWFNDRSGQLRKLLCVLSDLRSANQGREPSATALSGGDEQPPPAPTTVPRAPSTRAEFASEPYVEAWFSAPSNTPIPELKTGVLADVVVQIVEVEGPVHGDEVARRVTSIWGNLRTGSRIDAAVRRALNSAVKNDRLVVTDRFYQISGRETVPIRTRESVTSGGLKKPDMLPPQEIDAALLGFVVAHVGAEVEEAIRGVARLFGYRSTSKQLASRIEDRLSVLIEFQKLLREQNALRVP